MKKVAICGASGMVGTKLVHLLHKTCPLVLVGRTPQRLKQKFPFAVDCYSWEEFSVYRAEELGVIINISGANVSDQPWSDAYKKVMTDSRLNTTNTCVEVCKQNPDIRLINASAVSAYGFYDDDHEAFSEADTHRRTGTCFLQELIDQWEQATKPAMEAGNRVALLRIGVVFDRNEGALPTMATPFHKKHTESGKPNLFRLGRKATRVVLTTVVFKLSVMWVFNIFLDYFATNITRSTNKITICP